MFNFVYDAVRYIVSKELDQQYHSFHASIKEFNISPLVLLMDPEPNPNAKQLPLTFYEADVVTGASDVVRINNFCCTL